MEDLFYMREAPSLPSVEEQRAAFRAIGHKATDQATDRAYLDAAAKRPKKGAAEAGQPELDLLIKAIRRGAGDTVNIATAAVLAPTQEAALAVLRRLSKAGAGLRVAATGLYLAPGFDLAPVEFLDAIRRDANERRTKGARQGRIAAAARSRETQVAAWKLAAELWPDASIIVAEIARRTQIPATSLYRAARKGLLPPRKGMPVSARLALANAARNAKRKSR